MSKTIFDVHVKHTSELKLMIKYYLCLHIFSEALKYTSSSSSLAKLVYILIYILSS